MLIRTDNPKNKYVMYREDGYSPYYGVSIQGAPVGTYWVPRDVDADLQAGAYGPNPIAAMLLDRIPGVQYRYSYSIE